MCHRRRGREVIASPRPLSPYRWHSEPFGYAQDKLRVAESKERGMKASKSSMTA